VLDQRFAQQVFDPVDFIARWVKELTLDGVVGNELVRDFFELLARVAAFFQRRFDLGK
jgi:hypothetical protein